MTSDHDLHALLQEALEDGPQSAPMTSRATLRGRVHETAQRPAWRVRERGDEYPRRRNPQLRLLAIGVALVALLGMSFALGGPGSRLPWDGPAPSPSITTYPIDGQPVGIAIAEGDVWIGLFDQQAVLRLDPQTGDMTTISTQGRNCVSMSAGAGSVWVPSCVAAPLVRIDPATNTAQGVTPYLQGQTTSPVFDGSIGWLTLDVYRGRYALYDTVNQEELVRRELPEPGHIAAVAFGSAWAGIHPDGGPFRVLRLNLADGSETASIPVEGLPDRAVTTADGVWLSTLDEGAGRSALVRIDPATNQVAAVIEFDQAMIYPATDGQTIWALATGDDTTTVYRIDEADSSAIEVYALPGGAAAMEAQGNTLWLTRSEEREMVRIDLGGR